MDNQSVTDTEVDEGAVDGIHCNEFKEATIGNENFQCEPCRFENAEVEATAFCMDCSEHLCINCARDHRKNKISRNHKLLEGEEIPKDLKAIKVLKRMMACSDHPETDVTYKCEDHDKYICVTCIAECHRKCNEVNEISPITSPGNEDRCSIVKESLTQLQEYTSTSKRESEDNKKSLYSQLSAVQKEQQTLFDSIYEELSQRKKQLELETDELVTKELTEIEENLQKYNEAEKEEQEYQRLLDVILKCGNAREVNVVPDMITRKVKFLRQKLETKSGKEQAFLKFDCSMDLKTLANIGQVSVTYSEQEKQSDNNGEHRLSSDEVLEQENASDYTSKLILESSSSQYSSTKHIDEVPQQLEHSSLAKEQNDRSTANAEQKSSKKPPSLMKRSIANNGIPYNVSCADDILPCKIYAIVILPDERLVLIDNNNNKLKVLEQDFTLAYTFGFKENPIDMCHVYDTTVAVAFAELKAVEKYCIDETRLHNAGTFQTKFEIEALEKFGNDKKIAVLFSNNKDTCDESVFIQIRDTDHGSILKTFYLEKSPGVIFNFEDVGSNRILCRGTNEIFVSEFWKFHCFDVNKSVYHPVRQSNCTSIQESWFYKNRKGSFLKDVTDLADDEEGNIYVCCSKSKNIHQISADNFRENRIIITKIKEPLSVSVNSKKGNLIVGCGGDNYIHVYHFI